MEGGNLKSPNLDHAACSNKPLVARNKGIQLNTRNDAVKTTPS